MEKYWNDIPVGKENAITYPMLCALCLYVIFGDRIGNSTLSAGELSIQYTWCISSDCRIVPVSSATCCQLG
jgi:hypothetical protein